MMCRLHQATGPVLAALFAVVIGCGPDAINDALGPVASDLMPLSTIPTVVVDGAEYTYGCPDFPCPMIDMVKKHVDEGRWMLLARDRFPQPTLYLYALQVAVKLRAVPKEPDPPPPPFLKMDPTLAGPATMMGTHLPPDGQLACLKIGLEVVSPDGRSWDFVSGERMLRFDDRPALHTWLFSGEWGYLDAGMYAIYPGAGTGAYDAEFMIKVRGADGETHMLEHTMRCEDPEPPVQPPISPQMDGPKLVRGERLPELGLVCRDFSMEVISPDGGPWHFVSGTMAITYLRWGWDRQEWVKLDRPKTVVTLGRDRWDMLLKGDFKLVPKERSTAYRADFEAILRRVVGQAVYDYPVDEQITCVGPDLWDALYGAPG